MLPARRLPFLAALALIVPVLSLPLGAGAAPASESRFSDVTADHQFYAEITWLSQTGITTGYADGTFRPAAPVARKAMAAFLERFDSGVALPTPAYSPFSDVAPGHQFYAEITWLRDSGTTTGYPDGTFRPNGSIARQAMAAFLYRVAGRPAFTPPARPSFSDVPRSHQFFTEIEWLRTTGITTGYPDGTFRPRSSVARQAMAAFLMRYDHRFHGGDASGSTATSDALAASNVTTSGFDVSWTATPGAAGYRLSWGRSPTYVGASTVLTGAATARRLDGLRPRTAYHLRVEPLDAGGAAVAAPLTAEVTTVPLQPVNVATYNVQAISGASRPWTTRRAAVWAQVNSRTPDVVALQEASQNSTDPAVTHPTTPTRYYDDVVSGMRAGDTAYRLVNRMPWNCANPNTPGHQGWRGPDWTRCFDEQQVDQGASRDLRIAYNPATVEVVDSGSVLLSGPETIRDQRNDDRYLAWAAFEQRTTGKRFFFANLHLPPDDVAKRVAQARNAREAIDRLNVDGLPVVLAGDMNTARWDAGDAYGKVIGPFASAGYTDLQGGQAASWNRHGTGLGTRYVGRSNCSSYSGYQHYVLSSSNQAGPKCAHTSFNETSRNGNNLDYLFTKGVTQAPVFETVIDIDNAGRFRGTIPSDHNLVRAEILLP